MCGIIGIYNSDNIANEIYNGLLVLQHRGQDSCGILTVDDDSIYMNKYKGLVSEVFSENNLKTFKGRAGIGHVRYPTIGDSSIQDAQPFFLNYPLGVGMVHNGNVVNYDDLKKELKKNMRVLTSKCDVEVILNVLAEELLKAKGQSFERITESVSNIFKRINGGYSVISTSIRGRMVVFRDPYGIKPLIMAEKQTEKGISYAFSSETAPLEFLGFKITRDVKPGEVIYINSKGEIFSKVLTNEKPAHCMFEWVYFARPESVIEKIGIYDARINLGKQLAEEIKKKNINIDVVMPVPDSSRPCALSCAEALGKPYREGLVKNRYSHRTFIMPTQEARENAIRFKLAPVVKEMKGKSVLLVDDSIVRGTTSKRIIKMVKDIGAKEVHLAVSCPELKHPCYYGIDMSTEEELIAVGKTNDEIKEYINADSLTYQTINGLEKAIGISICKACLDGKYPTDISKCAEAYSQQRKNERKI